MENRTVLTYLQRGTLMENRTVFTAGCVDGTPDSIFALTVENRTVFTSLVENRAIFTAGCVDGKPDSVYVFGGEPDNIYSGMR